MNIVEAYKWYLGINSKCNADTMRDILKFHEKYRTKRGKLFCWHDWHLFGFVPYGTLTMITPVKSICYKCGLIRVKRHTPLDDDRMLGPHTVSYM